MKTLSRIVSIAAGILVGFGAGQGEAGVNVWTSGGPPAGPNGNSIAAVTFDPLTPTTVYAGGGALNRGAFKSVNGGGSWTPKNNGLTLDPVNFPLKTVNGIVVNHQNPSTVYAGTFSDGVFKSTNGGESWTPSNGPNSPASQQLTVKSVVVMAMDPQNPAIIYVGTTSGFFKSSDGGATWARKETGLTNLFVFSIAIDRLTPSTVYVSVQTERIFKSTNGGENWSPINNGLPSQGGVNFGVLSLAVDPNNSSVVYAGLSPGGVAKSTNGGASWAQTNQVPLNNVVESLAIDPVNSSTVYAGTNSGGVFRSTDGGANWTPINQGLGNVGVPALAISPSGTCLHAATFTVGVFDFETTPGGCSPVPVAAVLPTSRSVQVGATATAFVTMLNPSSIPAVGCSIAKNSGLNFDFTYQTTDAANAPTGTPNTPVNIAANGSQTFVIALKPNVPFPATEISFVFACTNTGATGVITGVNTLLLSASNSPVPDMVALAATTLNDGIVHIPGATAAGAFAVATVNVGQAGGSITATADTNGVALAINLTVCQTNPITGQCFGQPTASVNATVNPGETPTFAVFVSGKGNVSFDPALNRVFLRLKQGAETRGSTSVAVKTD